MIFHTEWRNFLNVINKAKNNCKASNYDVSDHFVDVNKIVEAGVTSKPINDMQLSRYAAYLIVLNADADKEVVALGKTYFAVKTRQQELIDNYDALTEDQKRLAIRYEMIEHNKQLVAAAKDAGVESSLDYAIFQNFGYMGYEELVANLFRATQTEAKLRRENIQGKDNANQTHFDVGKEVRDTIKRLGGTMPEDLPTPDKSIKQIEKEQKKLNN